jgi:pimeloyl-ACP methyl ester carboxylesterase
MQYLVFAFLLMASFGMHNGNASSLSWGDMTSKEVDECSNQRVMPINAPTSFASSMDNQIVKATDATTSIRTYLPNEGNYLMQRHSFSHNKLTFSYLDSGGSGPVLIALHAHFTEGSTFEPLTRSLIPEWRVIALDQRGHGHSDHAATYTRDDYLDDLEALFTHLKLEEPVVLLGNSLGGINAYQFAARNPALVRALIIEDIGVEVTAHTNISLAWEGTFKTRNELAQHVGSFLPYLQDSFRFIDGAWRLAFDPQELGASINLVQGDHWKDWLATDCPALVIYGQDSRITTQAHLFFLN